MRRAGAIGLLFFWCGSGCVLDLDERGAVAVSASRPANADRVVVSISAGAARFEVELVDRTVLNVPVGAVSIAGEARAGDQVIARDDEDVEVAAGATVEVMLDLSAGGADGGMADGGVPEVLSPPIDAIVRVRTDGIGGAFLDGEAAMSDEGAFLSFRANAQSELGSIASISVASASIQILPESQGVAVLDDLWNGQIVLSIIREDGSAFVEAASGTAQAGSTSAQLAAIGGADLSALSVESGRFKVGLRGATPRTISDDFDATVRTSIIFAAR